MAKKILTLVRRTPGHSWPLHSILLCSVVLCSLLQNPVTARTEHPITTAVEQAPDQSSVATKQSESPVDSNQADSMTPADSDTQVDQAVEKILARAPAEEAPRIEFNVENADLQSLLDYAAELFDVAFIADSAVKPMLQTGKGVAGNKITFHTEKPMTKKEAWGLLTTFLDISGLSLAQTPKPSVYRVTSTPAASKMPLVAYIGTDPEKLPDDNTPVRYVYFIKNSTVDNIKPVVDQLRSATATATAFVPLRALIITDKAYNVKTLMKIVTELDKASPPEMLSIIKLKYIGAEDLKKLYDELTKGDDPRGMVARIFGARRQAESFFFSESTKVIAEPRTNAVIVFGTQDTIKRLEEFVSKVDTELSNETSPLYIYELQHTDADSMAAILNNVTKFGIGTIVGQAGGVREGEKYFKQITFTPEKSGNRLIVKGDYEDYQKAKEIIEQLDVMQPQVALEVLIVNVALDQKKKLGTQWRPKNADSFRNLEFQTSGFNNTAKPVINTSTGSLLANLISLASGLSEGTTVMSLGQTGNIWAIFQALSSKVYTTVVSNPFLVTSNKYQATVALGEKRRITTSTVGTGANQVEGKDEIEAKLKVTMTPQINSEGIIILNIVIDIDDFVNTAGATKNIKHIETSAALANEEVLAVGGLIRNSISEAQSKVPILGDIPLLGWAFKNKEKIVSRSNLLVFISPHIIQPKIGGGINTYTKRKAEYSRKTLRATQETPWQRDPIHRWFFGTEPATKDLDNFMTEKTKPAQEDSNYYRNNTTPIKVQPQGAPVYQADATVLPNITQPSTVTVAADHISLSPNAPTTTQTSLLEQDQQHLTSHAPSARSFSSFFDTQEEKAA